MAIDPIPGNAGGTPPSPADSSKTRGFLDVTKEFVTTKTSDLAKATYLTIDTGSYFNLFNKADPVTEGIHHHAKLIRLAHAPGALVKNGIEWGEKTTEFLAAPSWSSATDAFFATNRVVAPVADIAEFTTKAIWNLPKSQFHTLQGVNGASLAIDMGKAIYDTGLGIAKLESCEVQNKLGEIQASLLKLVKAVSYVALGVLIVLATFFEVAVPPIVFTALSVNALVFSIMSFYYENMTGNKPLK